MDEPDAGAPGDERTAVSRRLLVAVVAMVVAGAIVLVPFVQGEADPTTLLRVGTFGMSRSFVERSLPDPKLTGDLGHDGQQFYVLASVFPDLRAADGHVDNLRYRARRIGFVVASAPFPDGPTRIWAMFAINLLAVGAAAWALARLAEDFGVSPFVGLAAGLTPGLLESLGGSLADGLAFALALWGVVLWRRHLGWAVALFTLAALTRETTLVVPLACLLVAQPRERLRLAVPFAAFGAWMVTTSLLLPATGSGTIVEDASKQLTWPFGSWFQLGFTSDGVLTALPLVIAGLAAAAALRRRRPELAWWLVFDTIVVICSAAQVTERPANIARVAPLAVAGVVLAILVERAGAPSSERTPVPP